MSAEEYPQLSDFLYEAIFIPEGIQPPPYSIIKKPELQIYISNFGQSQHDKAFVAVCDNKIVGAVWCRMMKDYGYVDDETPSLAISLYKDYRGKGIGTNLINTILNNLESCGYKQVSLAVQKANYAVKLYRKTGFVTIDENDEEFIMVRRLADFKKTH